MNPIYSPNTYPLTPNSILPYSLNSSNDHVKQSQPSSSVENFTEKKQSRHSFSVRKRKAIGRSLAPSNDDNKKIDKPWLQSKRNKYMKRKSALICLLAFSTGIIGAGLLIVFNVLNVIKQMDQKYCLVFEDNFDQGIIDPAIWTHEVQTGDWGTGSFEWTTTSPNNSFVKDGKLHLVPTLTADVYGNAGILNGVVVNLTESGGCTAANKTDAACAAVSNSTAGTILPPIQSARLNTKLSGKNIRYGKVEVTAKMPKGDWIWPAIWMMPVNNTYGGWPASGEIDIFESKGNPSRRRLDTLSARMLSTLHWGPIPAMDAYRKTQGYHNILRDFWTDSMHTFGLEWNMKRLVTWFNSRANVVLSFDFSKHPEGLWDFGHFPANLYNGTINVNPWTTADGVNDLQSAPFDQEFFLILNVAVGSTNGYFQNSDGRSGYMPWSDASANAARDFWNARDDWLPSWPEDVGERGMVVDSVKVWGVC